MSKKSCGKVQVWLFKRYRS